MYKTNDMLGGYRDMSEIKAGLLKRIYIVSALLSYVVHALIFTFHLYSGNLVLNVRTAFDHIMVLSLSLATVFMMMRIKNNLVELPQKTERIDSKRRKNMLLMLFVFALFMLVLTYIIMYFEARQIIDNNISVGSMLAVFILIFTIHSPLSGDE